MSAKPKRRWYQFSLRTLCILMTAIGVLLVWGVHEGGRRHRAVLRLQRAGASLAFKHKFIEGAYNENGAPPGSPVLKQVFGEYYATCVDQIELLNPEAFTDVEAREIAGFTELDWIAISGSRITDKGLEDIARLNHLGRLDIERCNVSETAVIRLRRALPHTRIHSDYD